MANAITSMIYSTRRLCMMLMPSIGKLEKNKGSRAQCMAQAKVAPIPNASQFSFHFIR